MAQQGQQQPQQQHQAPQNVTTSDYSRLYGVAPALMGHPRLMFPSQQFPQGTEAGVTNAMMSSYMSAQAAGRPAYVSFHPMMSMPQMIPFSGSMPYLPAHSTSLPAMTGGMPQHINPAAMMSQEDMSRFAVMPQMQKKTPRKGSIQTQEDELATNIPDLSTTKPEPPAKRSKASRKPRSNKEPKRSKQSSGRGSSRKDKDKDGAGKSASSGGKSKGPRSAHSAKKAAAAMAATAAQQLAEPSLTELLSKYVRHRPPVCDIMYGRKDHMKTWAETGVPGHFKRPSDVKVERTTPTFDDIVRDEGFEARRTSEAKFRTKMVVQQFESIFIDDQDTTERVQALTEELDEERAHVVDSLSKDDAEKLESCIDYLKEWDTVAQEQRVALDKCLRSFEKLPDSQQRSIASMINKHGPKRPRR
ncbi:hypothetical protein PTSG_03720 [Salpingoeca rosetta]|uniref:Uncharacterized protein n=1 Tax=Salpingoeca rosetta (strain ATCC 50818 / BSB-021) TaxID=946362 RepID=F2U6E1_SALR5|nr:uncharacterized protein PTSG_03720 [Salpingoeca rosetta]EGD83082.1 hypothetical protein PTSG_03720 [Salpingoeca rosetta]|eukprot:XP_004995446.1 hypothetical protein PTSG_03720 [Salpingoeca rosetta]